MSTMDYNRQRTYYTGNTQSYAANPYSYTGVQRNYTGYTGYGTRNQSGKRYESYTYGTAAAEVDRLLEEESTGMIKEKSKERVSRRAGINLPLLLTMLGAACISFYLLANYVGTQSDVTKSIRAVNSLEAEYNTLKEQNDADYDRIVTSVDMNEIKRIATQELGMHYAADGQVIGYTYTAEDYVRQYSDIAE